MARNIKERLLGNNLINFGLFLVTLTSMVACGDVDNSAGNTAEAAIGAPDHGRTTLAPLPVHAPSPDTMPAGINHGSGSDVVTDFRSNYEPERPPTPPTPTPTPTPEATGTPVPTAAK